MKCFDIKPIICGDQINSAKELQIESEGSKLPLMKKYTENSELELNSFQADDQLMPSFNQLLHLYKKYCDP